MMRRCLFTLLFSAACILAGCRKEVPPTPDPEQTPPTEETQPEDSDENGIEDMPEDGQGVIHF